MARTWVKNVERPLVLARMEECEAVLVHGLDPARPRLHRLLVLPECLLVLAEGVVGVAEIVVEGRVVRVDLEAPPEDADRLLGIAHRAIDATKVIVGEDVVLVELDGPGVGHLGGLEPAGLAVGVAEHEEDLGVLGVQVEGPLEGAYRVLGLPELQVDGAHVEEGVDVRGLAREDAREGAEGLLGAVGPKVDRPEEEASLIRLGVLEKVLPREALGRVEVAELEGAARPVQELVGVFRRCAHHRAVLKGLAETSAENSPARDSGLPGRIAAS